MSTNCNKFWFSEVKTKASQRRAWVDSNSKDSTVLTRPIRPLKHPANSVLAGGMTDDRRTGRGRTVHRGDTGLVPGIV